MDNLRAAILAILSEDMDAIDEPVYSTKRLIDAWNELPDVTPITY